MTLLARNHPRQTASSSPHTSSGSPPGHEVPLGRAWAIGQLQISVSITRVEQAYAFAILHLSTVCTMIELLHGDIRQAERERMVC